MIIIYLYTNFYFYGLSEFNMVIKYIAITIVYIVKGLKLALAIYLNYVYFMKVNYVYTVKLKLCFMHPI